MITELNKVLSRLLYKNGFKVLNYVTVNRQITVILKDSETDEIFTLILAKTKFFEMNVGEPKEMDKQKVKQIVQYFESIIDDKIRKERENEDQRYDW